MKILADTNILISAMLFPNSKPAKALLHAARNHELVLSDYNIYELRDVLGRKVPHILPDVDVFLAELRFEIIIAPEYPEKLIEDPKDQPILNAAIVSDVDIIISGDKHFLKLDTKKPRTVTAAQYLDYVGSEG